MNASFNASKAYSTSSTDSCCICAYAWRRSRHRHSNLHDRCRDRTIPLCSACSSPPPTSAESFLTIDRDTGQLLHSRPRSPSQTSFFNKEAGRPHPCRNPTTPSGTSRHTSHRQSDLHHHPPSAHSSHESAHQGPRARRISAPLHKRQKSRHCGPTLRG